MPKPKAGETRKGFVDRCIPVVIADGTAKDGAAAMAVCNSMWEEHDTAELSANTAAGDRVWLDVSDGRRTGQYRKDVIRVGNFTHPGTGQRVIVTPERLRHWHETYHEMQAAGINVPIKDGHKGAALGHIAGSSLNGDKLDMVHDFPDDDAAKIAKRNRFVSVGVVDTYTDCTGRTWHDVIDHVAVTGEPVITRQGEFVALSRTDFDVAPSTGAAPVVTPQQKEKPMEWLNELLGLAADADDDARKAKIAELKAAVAKPADPPKTEPAPVAMSVDAVEAITEAQTIQLEALQRDGHINQACREDLQLALIGTAEKPNTMCLSRAMSNTDRSIVSMVVAALRKNVAAPKAGEQTGAQLPAGSVALARPEDGAADAAKTEEQKKADNDKRNLLMAIPTDKRTPEAQAFLDRTATN